MIPAERRKAVTFNQNGRSRSVGTTGHVQTESAVNFVRNTQLLAVVENMSGYHCIRWQQLAGL
jgi:hypothetical protein